MIRRANYQRPKARSRQITRPFSNLRLRSSTSAVLFYVALAIFLISPVTAKTNFDTCIKEIRDGKWGTIGGTDNNRNPVDDISKATAITYDLCVRACGSGPEPFKWSSFSQEFSAWLLPWLALVSQLPFGAKLRQHNFLSVVLTVGSPMLAAYSLALTVLNEQWVARHFGGIKYPNSHHAVHVLRSLQQVPLHIETEGALLSSLIVLSENDAWWRELLDRLEYNYTWTLSSATSIAWVIVAYVFTVVDSFTNITAGIDSNGQGIGSVWLWLLPVVTGWLQISPKCDYIRVAHAIECSNNIAFVSTQNGVVKASRVSEEQALSLDVRDQGSLSRVQKCSPPIFNYARFFSWVQAVEDVRAAFCAASKNAIAHFPVDPNTEWKDGDGHHIEPENRSGTAEQVEAYCQPPAYVRRSRWGPNVLSQCLIAAAVAFGLQWGTAGAAIIALWFTPTKGLGCRSGAYLLYASNSTIVCVLLVTSSILAHYAILEHRSSYRLSYRIAGFLSVLLRRLGYVLAACNAVWIIVVCLFQFGNFFDRCYCNGSVLGLGAKAFDVLSLNDSDVSMMKNAWIGGVVLASGCASFFVGFVYVYLNPPSHD